MNLTRSLNNLNRQAVEVLVERPSAACERGLRWVDKRTNARACDAVSRHLRQDIRLGMQGSAVAVHTYEGMRRGTVVGQVVGAVGMLASIMPSLALHGATLGTGWCVGKVAGSDARQATQAVLNTVLLPLHLASYGLSNLAAHLGVGLGAAAGAAIGAAAGLWHKVRDPKAAHGTPMEDHEAVAWQVKELTWQREASRLASRAQDDLLPRAGAFRDAGAPWTQAFAEEVESMRTAVATHAATRPACADRDARSLRVDALQRDLPALRPYLRALGSPIEPDFEQLFAKLDACQAGTSRAA